MDPIASRHLPPSPPRKPSDYLDHEAKREGGPKFYECGICGAMHPLSWDGDCREDAARFNPDDLDARFGAFNGWEEVEMPGGESACCCCKRTDVPLGTTDAMEKMCSACMREVYTPEDGSSVKHDFAELPSDWDTKA